jgi:uncharacterized protein (TIRG00374 family)
MSNAPDPLSMMEAQASEDSGAPDEPTSGLSVRKLAFAGVFTIAALAGLYFLIPKLAGLNQTWGQLKHGDPVFLVIGMVCELASIGGYIVLFRTVFSRGTPRIDWRVSIEIPLAGIAAIRLLAAAGAGGVAVSIWALRRAGMSPRVVTCRLVASYVIQYAVYLLALVICGLGLRWGVFSGEAPFALTAIPALFSAVAIALVASMGLVPQDFERRLDRLAQRSGRIGRLAARFAAAPAIVGSGVRTALGLLRERRLGLLGAVAYWGFDIAVLGFCLKAFQASVPGAVLVMCYFLGTLGSLLPLPGGIGGVEGGMIGAFVAFGVPGSRALIGVLAYRAISFWLPTLPGIGGYIALHKTVREWQLEGGGEGESRNGETASAPTAAQTSRNR